MKRVFDIAVQMAALGMRERNGDLLRNAAARLEEIAASFEGKAPSERATRDLDTATKFLDLIAKHGARIGLSESAAQLACDAAGLKNPTQAFKRIECGFAQLVFDKGERLDEIDEARALMRKERRQRYFKSSVKH